MTPDALNGRRVLVTGAGGFLGAHTVRALLEEGAEVHGAVRGRDAPRLAPVRGDVTEHEVEVGAADEVLRAMREISPDVVVHLAADTTVRRFAKGDWDAIGRSIAVNLGGTLNVLRASLECGSVTTFIRAGGLEEYGNGPTPYHEEQREQPISPYSASQVAATHYCQMLQEHTETTIVTLRPALLYGPAQASDFLIPALIGACLRGDDFALSRGDRRRDLLYVEDAADAFVRAATATGTAGAVVNLGHGVAHSMREVAEEIVAMTGSPTRLVEDGAVERPVEIRHLVTTTDAARRLLGWKPRVGLREGLERTIGWYRRRAAEPTG